MQDINNIEKIARVGLCQDNVPEQSPQGYLTYALNAINSSFDGQSVNYQNEQGDVFCMVLPQGYKCVGVVNVMQIYQAWYWLTNPSTGFSQIGYVQTGTCTFVTVVDDSLPGSDLLGLDINYPIHKIEIKTTNCSTQAYWTDNNKERRYIDFQNLPWKIGTTNLLDTDKIAVQPRFVVPIISADAVNSGGILIEGDYQFAIQYANIRSEGLTSFYNVTNPVRIFLDGKVSLNYNEVTNKSINISIVDLDNSGLYEYFNLAVIKTINGNVSVDLVSTVSIQNTTWSTTYTGAEQSSTNIPLTLQSILGQFDYYDKAGDLTQADHRIIWADLTREDDFSYQKIFNQVNVQWCTVQVPTGQKLGYHDGVVCANYEGYFRDEIYALEGCFILQNGKQTTRFHIPGRVSNSFDLTPIEANADVNSIEQGTCPIPGIYPRWKVYNTGTVIGNLPGSVDPCTGVKPWEYGAMSYWESTEVYPSNTDIWGILANQPIRHHKFPDSAITHIHDDTDPELMLSDTYIQQNPNMYPIGFLVDVQSLWNAIQLSTDLTTEQKSQIQGFKIMRSDRAGNNSIVAKGWLSNCGVYEKQGINYYYPNYSFNDVRPDPFISTNFVEDESGSNSQSLLNDFQNTRFTFHSPDTHFNQASGIPGSFLKLETAEWGTCKSHFVQVLNNAGEKIRTVKALELAFAAGVFSILGLNASIETGTTGIVTTINPTLNVQNFFPTYTAMLDIIDKLDPYINYGWQYNGVGHYNNYTVIPNDNGNKIRSISYGGYLANGLNTTFGDNYSFNNTNRETSVYLSVNDQLPFTHEQSTSIPQDTSRQIATEIGKCRSSVPFYEPISSYYATIKRTIDDQYGEIFSYRSIDTGYNAKLDKLIYDPAMVFGGDCFINPFALKIKHPFFLKSTVGKEDGYDIDYNQDAESLTNTGNVGYPIYYYSTSNKLLNINNTALNGDIVNFMNSFTFPDILLNIVTGGLVGIVLLVKLMADFINNGLLKTLGLKITNLDCQDNGQLYEQGMAYLYSYGVINFFCESTVNVDMRQAYDQFIGNFYPNVGSDIPDVWLQETFTSIAADNTYTYNKTYSKENHETAFTLLRPDWAPGQTCYTTYNNRAIWSEQSSLEETKNNWLVYRPANLFDFPKNFGALTGIDALDSREVLVRYENHSQIYNALSTIETSGLTAIMGSGALFSGSQPLDFPVTDGGNMGSQNKFLLSTDFGHIYVDAMRGQVVLLRGHSPEDLSSAKYLNNKWFSQNLPFNIINSFPTYPIDNNFNNIGLTGVYDSLNKRVIITKKDYALIQGKGLNWDGTNFYVNTRKQNYQIIKLGDPTYFCDQSWTVSFSFISNTWLSYHSYLPDFYIEYQQIFQAGYNSGTFSDVWNHNSTFDRFCTYRGVQYPYIIEYPLSFNQLDQQLQSISDYCTVLKYSSFDQATEPNEIIYFNKLSIYSTQQCTGTLILVPKDNNSMRQYRQYPQYNANSTSVLVTKDNYMYNVNMFWDHVITPDQPIWLDTCGTTTGDKILNDSNMDYSVRSYKKYPISSKELKVRYTLDNQFQYKLINKFLLVQHSNDYV